mmetsp:Transcript_35882/g.43861  ORF Transcript_35882/g.43861 Transcript_35882/m.43861 type:complete len:129 (-) Transcript_35882:64-450(-)|eukprot:CAMPEP_0170468900 /NCGR_PEP_ID=MMETSP0123-20130129/11911_1 /TAXON_ID=182087 /ORGANISM="Favella ehrenbergii, Strain Fehren 1" /LENGTH=128 /DNA_ID=CAMNT_0010735593 /DNA_START=589 /DNA_END=975 /DNA_ORIENTATION=-
MPGSAYQKGSTVEDIAINAAGSNDIDIVTSPWTDLCTEKWYLTATAIACVEMSGIMKRKRNTGDVTNDIILDYASKYQMHAMIGLMSETEDAFKFAAQEVDFTTFFASGAHSVAPAAALGAILYVLSF